MAALVAGDLPVAPGAGASRADSLLPLYVPGERAHERHPWLADLLIALLQRAQVGAFLACLCCQGSASLMELPSSDELSLIGAPHVMDRIRDGKRKEGGCLFLAVSWVIDLSCPRCVAF